MKITVLKCKRIIMNIINRDITTIGSPIIWEVPVYRIPVY